MVLRSHRVQVRALRTDDRTSWGELWNSYLAFYRATVPDPMTELAFKRLSQQQEGMLGLVLADAEDCAVGLAHLVFHVSTWSEHGYCYLEDLYLDPSHRGSDAVDRLFDAIDQYAIERGVSRLYWHTQQYNGPARSLYDVVGQLTSYVVYERRLARSNEHA